MAFFRNMVILGTVVALLPTDEQSQGRLYQQAAGAVHWTVTFCDRNAATCSNAAEAWSVFVAKAQFGLRMIGDIYEKNTRETGHTTLSANSTPPHGLASSKGTLRPADLQPAWRAQDRNRRDL